MVEGNAQVRLYSAFRADHASHAPTSLVTTQRHVRFALYTDSSEMLLPAL